MKKFSLVLAALALLATPAKTLAGPIPYNNPGVENPDTYTFIAGNGDVKAYFYGSSASYGSEIALLVNNVSTGQQGLFNHSSSYGDWVVLSGLGGVSAGDTLIFQLLVQTGGGTPGGTPDYSVYSKVSMNSDLKQHIYSTDFAGDIPTIPAGTYVGFEDILGGGDLDYNDHEFIFTNIGLNQTSVPDGGSALVLLGAALTGLGMLRRRIA